MPTKSHRIQDLDFFYIQPMLKPYDFYIHDGQINPCTIEGIKHGHLN